jgi:hypothetical protein
MRKLFIIIGGTRVFSTNRQGAADFGADVVPRGRDLLAVLAGRSGTLAARDRAG